MPGRKSVILSPGSPGGSWSTNSVNDLIGSGSCILSKAAGFYGGVAKKANVVMVKLPDHVPRTADLLYTISNILNALNRVLQELILSQTRAGPMQTYKNVLNISWSQSTSAYPIFCSDAEMRSTALHHTQLSRLDIARLKEIFRAMIKLGMVITVAYEVGTYPAMFSPELDLIVVAPVDRHGITLGPSPRGDGILGAPGEDVVCAPREGNIPVLGTGPGFAAPMAAGLAAYLMSDPNYSPQIFGDGIVGNISLNVKTVMQSLAYVRGSGNIPSIWNGQPFFKQYATESSGSCSSGDEFPTIKKRGSKPVQGPRIPGSSSSKACGRFFPQ